MRYQLITFDVYTALFDIESSLTPSVRATLDLPDALTFVRAWRRKQLELALISNSLARGRMPFEQITHLALNDTLQRAQLHPSTAEIETLTAAWLTLQPWDEAAQVLTTLHARGYTLGLLSNGDTAQLHALARQLPPVFTHIFSTEQAGYYKPHPSVYALPLRALNFKPDEVLHVAGSATDALGTKSAGVACAWSNRNHDPHLDPNLRVDHKMPDLSQLLSILK